MTIQLVNLISQLNVYNGKYYVECEIDYVIIFRI
jgi:hypothetical protein